MASDHRSASVKETRLALILAAERIFAEEGISNTSLRRINQVAGQRNESAIHYYFGSREGVVAAILEHRTGPINTARVDMIRSATERRGDLPLDSRDIAEALVRPLTEHLRANKGDTYYLRFQSMLWLDRPIWKQFERDERAEGLKLGLDALLRSKPFLPETLVKHRYGLALQMVANSLSRVERSLSEACDWQLAELEFLNLIDAVEAIFEASPSAQVVAALKSLDDQ
ncbi:TetR/AcrR family transcriptional regulator [Minwuia sp.]|uniref:TetR/AcrR family transcriptional regulator n=1 Tax=Minwuia sp. TaxID=2493630 RepID=UPI003A8ECD2A